MDGQKIHKVNDCVMMQSTWCAGDSVVDVSEQLHKVQILQVETAMSADISVKELAITDIKRQKLSDDETKCEQSALGSVERERWIKDNNLME